MFADLVGFTEAAHHLPPEEVVDFLDRLVRAFDGLSERYGVDKIKTIGDSYMAAAGFDGRGREGAVAIGRLALAMLDAIGRQPPLGGRALQLRIGIHCGPATAGVIGDTRFSYDVWGDAVNTASRMESNGEPGRIHVSESFRALTPTRSNSRNAAPTELKGIGEPCATLFPAAREARDAIRNEKGGREGRLSSCPDDDRLFAADGSCAAARLRPSAWLRGPRRSPGRRPSSTGGSCRARRSRGASP